MATSPTAAVSAASFVSSIGINVHMWEATSGYGNLSLVENSLAYLGILNVRDNYIPSSSSAFTALANSGYKLDLAIPSDAITIANFVTQIDAFNAAHPGSIKAIEGPNEVNIWTVNYNGGSSLANAAQYQQAFYSAVRADSHLSNIPVYNLSLAYLDSTQYAQVGDLSGSANYANSHAYLNNAYAPQWSFNIILPFAKLDATSLPTVITETGYNTDPNDGYSGVDQTVQAKYTLDTLMDAYKDGVATTYLYELLDDVADPGNTNAQYHYGLFNADGTPKLAATAIHNLTAILNDPGASSSFTPGTLNYSVSNLTAPYGNQLLLQKSNGAFDLVLWGEPKIYNPTTDTEIAAPNDTVTVNFAQVEGTVTVYDPLLGNTPIATYHNVQQIQVNITDHPLVVEISNGSTPPPPPSTTVIESFGSTSLTEVGNNFYLYNGAGSGPELKYGSAAVVAGQFSTWTPIGAEQTATGYEVAWKVPGTNQYTVWTSDSSGNYLSNIGTVSGTSSALESLETSFHQDLNGDGVIGIPTAGGPHTTVIESFGSTSLVEIGNNYFLDNSAGSGPDLKYGGANVADGQFAGWTPTGAEKTASGYEVAWHNTSTDQYTVWNTDGSGNYLSNIGTVSGTSSALESLETSFHQDLNGDGQIGLGTVIESFGVTSLVAMGNNFFLDNSAGSGPELKYGSAAVVAGQFSTWTPIGAEQTATGYEVAWKVPGANQYTVWTTDNSGNYLSNIGTVSGTSATLESLENSFHQDLNGDGHIGTNPLGAPTNDVLVANPQGGTLTGGAGNDTFVFNFPVNSASTITDFASGQDLLQISAAGFGHGLTAGAAPTLVIGVPAGVSHAGSDGYFIFDNTDPHGGTVYWDATGGSGTDATALVHLQGVTSLHLTDFHLV